MSSTLIHKVDSRTLVGRPAPLFTIRPKRWRWGRGYDVTADGQRFVVNTLLTQESGAPLTLVVNWSAGLKQK